MADEGVEGAGSECEAAGGARVSSDDLRDNRMVFVSVTQGAEEAFIVEVERGGVAPDVAPTAGEDGSTSALTGV
jgi:hypothetical protein